MNITDATFLKALDNEKNKFYYARIVVLDRLNKPIKSIEGRVQQGSSISINGNSSVRRTCNINLVAEDADNDLTNIENFLSVNKKIKIAVGLKKTIDYSKDVYYFAYKDSQKKYDESDPYGGRFPETGEKGKIYVDRYTMTYWIWTGKQYMEIGSIYDYEGENVWFPLGVFVINQPSISHTTTGCNISLSCKDKMCLLNGEMGGGLPASVTFHEYDQIVGELEVDNDPRTDATLEPNNYTVYKYKEAYYAWNKQYGWYQTTGNEIGSVIHIPQLIFDIIQTVVANYGGEALENIIINDVPLELKQLIRYVGSNSLLYNNNTGQYVTDEFYKENEDTETEQQWEEFGFNEDVGYVYTDFTYPGKLITNIGDNVCSVLDKVKNALGNYEYFYDIDGNFVFQEIRNYLNTNYDYFENLDEVQKYYLDNNGKMAIESNSLRILGTRNYFVDYYGDQKSIYTFTEDSGLIVSYSNSPNYANLKNDYHIWGKNEDGFAIHYHLVIKEQPKEMTTREVVFIKENDKYTGGLRLARKEDEDKVSYTPSDWRAELYLQGLEIAAAGGRPDIYQQELLDLFDNIYEFGYYDDSGNWRTEGRFKTDIVNNPNALNYFIDYLEPVDRLYGIAVDDIGTKIYSNQQDKIIRLYDNEVPNYIILDESMDNNYEMQIMSKCDAEGQPHSVVDKEVYDKLSIGTYGYSAQEKARDFLYQYTSYNENITLSCIPIYYLDVNQRITVRDRKSNIFGDYVIKSITLPLCPSSTMNITASRALNRI